MPFSKRTYRKIPGDTYVQNETGDYDEHTILLLLYDLDGTISTPMSIGGVPGWLLNKFSIDHAIGQWYCNPVSGKRYSERKRLNISEWPTLKK